MAIANEKIPMTTKKKKNENIFLSTENIKNRSKDGQQKRMNLRNDRIQYTLY